MGRGEDGLEYGIGGADTEDKTASGISEGPDLIIGQRSGIEIEVQEVLKTELVDHSGMIIEDLLTVGRYPSLFKCFIRFAKQMDMNLVLHTDADSTVLLFRKKSPCQTPFVIPNIATFVEEMENLYELFAERYLARINSPEERSRYEFDMLKYDRFWDALLDVTPSDCPSRFFARRRQELLNGPTIAWDSTRELASGNMALTSATSDGMEGYFQFSSTYLIEGRRAALSEVRYGIVSESEGVIYAVQNPKIDGMSPKSAEIALQVLASRRQKLQEICENLTTAPAFFANGAINDEELLKFYEEWADADPILIALGMKQGETRLVFDYVELLIEKAALEKIVEESQMNQDAARVINKALRRGLPDRLGSIRNVPGQAFLALLGAIKVLHESGIRKIKIPMKLPLRMHSGQQEIDEHIYNGKLSLVKRLVFELEGVNANTEDCAFNARDLLTGKAGGAGVDYLVVDLADLITPQREVIQQIWNG